MSNWENYLTTLYLTCLNKNLLVMDASDVVQLVLEVAPDSSCQPETVLIGGQLDSMALVQLCLRLEDSALDQGFAFDWSSEKAMSSMNSVFLTPVSISLEFNRQKNLKK